MKKDTPAKKKKLTRKKKAAHRGRPFKFKNITKRELEIIAKMYRMGFTDQDVADAFSISRGTVCSWRKRKKNIKLLNTVTQSKDDADAMVEMSLFERAIGYTHPEARPQWVSDPDEDDGGHWVYADMTKHYPPDTAAAFIWLKNRKPEQWRDQQHISHDIETVEDKLRKIRGRQAALAAPEPMKEIDND